MTGFTKHLMTLKSTTNDKLMAGDFSSPSEPLNASVSGDATNKNLFPSYKKSLKPDALLNFQLGDNSQNL